MTSDHGFITAVQATDRRNDIGLARPMLEETERRTGAHVKRLLADSGYASVDDIAALGSRAEGAVTVYVPQPEEKKEIKPENLAARLNKRAKEPEAVKEWRKRMAASEAGNRDRTAGPDRAGQCAIEEPRAWHDARAQPEEGSV